MENPAKKVYLDPLTDDDLFFIAREKYPDFPEDILLAMVEFNYKIFEETMVKKSWGGRGSPWEFNLRDLCRWCDLLKANQTKDSLNPGEYVGLIYKYRMRTAVDKAKVEELYVTVFDQHKYPLYHSSRKLFIGQSLVQVGHSFLPRATQGPEEMTVDKCLPLHHSLEHLEALMKCVEMGWLSILVGPQSSGKTSLVKLLAQITTNQLSIVPMNMTELFRAFEQSKVRSDLWSVKVVIEAEVGKLGKECMNKLETSYRALLPILEQDWRMYTNLPKNPQELSFHEAVALLTKHFTHLQQVLGHLEKIGLTSDENLSEVRRLLSQLSASITSMKPGAGGGALEWVDSPLIKAWENGYWLLFDDVHLCSTSVLDIVNCLLEPEGVLSIDERTVKRHPNFRLFIAIDDSRSGEIPRATTSVELYLLGEHEGCPYSKSDIFAMMEELGLRDVQVCKWWLALHVALKAEMPCSEKPVIADLLNVCTSFPRFMGPKYNMQQAMFAAAEEVYVLSKRNTATKQLATTIIKESLPSQLTLVKAAFSAYSGVDLREVTKSSGGEPPGMATIKEDARLMLSILEEISQNSRGITCAMKVHLETATLIFTSLQSELTWKLALEWLQSVATDILPKLCSASSFYMDAHNFKAVVNFEAIVDYWKTLSSDCLQQVYEGSAWSELKGTLEMVFATSPKAAALLREQPWDLTFNPQASKRAAFLHVATCGQGLQGQDALSLSIVQKLISRIQLVQHCVVLRINIRGKLDALKTLGKGKKWSLHPSIGLISLLLAQISEQLPQLVLGLSTASLDSLCEEPYNLLWISRLADIALTWTTVHKDVFVAHLALHWHWMENKLGHLLTHSQSQSPKLAMVVQELKGHLGGGDAHVRLHTKFWTAIGHPRPFASEKEASLAQALSRITAALTLSHTDSQSLLQKKVKILTSSGLFCQSQVWEIMTLMARGEDDLAEKALQDFTSLLTKRGLMQASKKTHTEVHQGEDMSVSTVTDAVGRKRPSQFVALWPLFGHISLLAQMSETGNQLLQTTHLGSTDDAMAVDDSETSSVNEILRDFVINYTPELPDWNMVKRESLMDDFMRDLQQLLSKLWSTPTCYKHMLWMNWPESPDELDGHEEDLGPAVLHCTPVSKFAMHMLSRNSQLTNTTELLPLHVSLGDLREQAQEIWLLSRHVWCHSSTLASPLYDARFLQKKLLLQSFIKLIAALQSLLAPASETVWAAVLENLKLNQHVTQQALGELQNLFTCSSHHLPEHISVLLPRCLEIVYEALQETNSERLTPLVGHGLVWVGLVLTHFLTPIGTVDPLEKARQKLDHVVKEIKEVEAELSTWRRHLEIRTGRGINKTHKDHLHPRILAQLERLDKLKRSRTKLEQFSAYRPDQFEYTKLSKDMNNFTENSCSVSKISDLIRKLNISSQPSSIQQGHLTYTAALQEEQVWQSTTQRFLHSLMANFQCYMDVVVPFCVGVQEMKLGLRLMAGSVHKTLKAKKLGCSKNISSVVGSLCSFPTISQSLPEFLSLANQLACSNTIDTITCLLQSADEYGETKDEQVQGTKSRLLLCALLLLKAHSFSTRHLDRPLLSALSHVLQKFVAAWSEQEDRRKQKEAEYSALFRYKEQTHGDERSDKEIEEAEFIATYPSFEQDFIDVTGAVRLEDVGLENTTAAKADSTKMVFLEGISPKEMAQVCSAHSEIFTTLSHADWLEESAPTPSSVADVLTPSLMSYQIGAAVIRTAFDVLDHETDSKILGSHLLVGESVLQYLDPSSNSCMAQDVLKTSSGKTSYNIYYDANVPEIIKCTGVIDSLRKRVTELQLEWPDHPTLVLLNQIMDRILSFSVTSPVVKFLTGLELLLEKAQDWQSNAYSFVSMATQLSEITAVIVQWRKLELSCWSSALDREDEKCKEKASHWWFHLFQLTSAFLANSDSLSGPSTTDTSTQNSILDSLKKFMESSTMGEYSFRLHMLLAFHCQLLHVDPSPAQKQLLHMLWNVYLFYKQFQPCMEAEIKRLRVPIDEQLKGFVEIARCSDLNWALKSSTEKTHRTVHKYIKEYQAVLNQPSKNMLGDRGDDLVAQAVKQISSFQMQEQIDLFTQTVKVYLKTTNAGELIHDIPVSTTGEVSLLPRVPRTQCLFRKMRNDLIQYLDRSQLSQLITVFDDFTGELIQKIHSLQELQINLSAEKDKQKSEAKSFNMRKRKALSELFKYLTQIGLSYRKGVSGKAGLGLSDALNLPPLNLQAHPKLPVTNLWTGCESYFYRCISRYAQFSAAIVSPSKELTMADIERIRGFIEHFSKLYADQRRQLTSLASDFLSLRSLLGSLNSLRQLSSYMLPPQSESHSWVAKTKQLTTQLTEGLQQFMLLLESCPTKQQESSLMAVHPSPFSKDKLAPCALWSRGDTAWTQCFDTLQDIMRSVKEEQAKIDMLLDKTLLGRSDLETVAKVLETYQCFTSQLTQVASQFSEDTTRDTCCLISSLKYLSAQISSTHDHFHQWHNTIVISPYATDIADSQHGSNPMDTECPGMARDFVTKAEGLVEALLLSVQHVVKPEHKEVTASVPENDLDSDDLKEAHLTRHLLDAERTVITSLNCKHITSKLESLVSDICKLSDGACSGSSPASTSTIAASESVALCVQSLLQAMPLVVAFNSLVDSQLGHSIALHRSMGKLLSVLLAVFTELSQKLEEARKPGQEETEKPEEQPDVCSKDNSFVIEMS